MTLRDEIYIDGLVNFYNDYHKKNGLDPGKNLISRNGKKNGILEPLLSFLVSPLHIDDFITGKVKRHEAYQPLIIGFEKICKNAKGASFTNLHLFDIQLETAIKTVDKTSNYDMFTNNSNSLYEEMFSNKHFEEHKISSCFKTLVNKCCVPHFTPEEINQLNDYLKTKDYQSIFSKLWIHAFVCAEYNLPHFYAEHSYQEALTLKKANTMRRELLRVASSSIDIQNSQEASLAYGMDIFETDFDEGVKSFLSALKLDAAYWVIAFQLEFSWEKCTANNSFLYDLIEQNDDIQYALNVLNDSLYIEEVKDAYSYRNIVPTVTNEAESECLELAIKIYLYLITTKNFPKAYNSIGKLLLLNKIRLKDEVDKKGIDYSPKSRKLAIKLLNQAIRLGNGNALVNLSRYYMQRMPDTKLEIPSKIIKEAKQNLTFAVDGLKLMADLHEAIACEFYADYMSDTAQKENGVTDEYRINEAIKYYQYALDNKRPSVAQKLIALLEQKGDFQKAYAVCQQAADLGLSNTFEFLSVEAKRIVLEPICIDETKQLKRRYEELLLVTTDPNLRNKFSTFITTLETLFNE